MSIRKILRILCKYSSVFVVIASGLRTSKMNGHSSTPGRILVPGQVQAPKMFWKKSALFTDGRTQQAIQLSGKDMRVIERVGEGQLPSSTDADCTVRGAMKTAQIGPDAASKIFKLLTEIWLKNIIW